MDHQRHQSLQNTHVKLLACSIHALAPTPDPTTFTLHTNPRVSISRAEAVGTVTSRDLKPGKFLRFALDDGTAALPCLLWLNHLSSPYFSRRSPADVSLLASHASRFAADVTLGAVVRVRGKVSSYRGEMQITVGDVVVERDPHAEILHWIDCMRLWKKVYNVVIP